MYIHGSKQDPIYEVEFEAINPLTKKHERKWDYVHAQSTQHAKDHITWIYGQHVNFINVLQENDHELL